MTAPIRWHRLALLLLVTLSLLLVLPGCVRERPSNDDDDAADDDDDDDSTPPQNEGTVCHGDALAENVPLDDDLDSLRQRWDMNKELLRILFVGEPL
jgi:hypothetical protein